jgi:hypothetical protein
MVQSMRKRHCLVAGDKDSWVVLGHVSFTSAIRGFSLTKRKNHSMSLLQSGRSITIRDFHKGIRDIVLHTLRSQPR